ncbi:MAG: hypothetical protein PUC88_03080 [Clostridia bacterium]|nr:hypothetical protein [Clostridia bacterium]
MKRSLLVFLTLLVVFVFSGCSNKSDIVVTDYETGKTAVAFSSKDYQEEAAKIIDMINYLSDEEIHTTESPKYRVHFIDPKDSKYDIWFSVYDIDSHLYVKMLTEKMSEHYSSFYDDSVKEVTTITVDEFNEIMSKDY